MFNKFINLALKFFFIISLVFISIFIYQYFFPIDDTITQVFKDGVIIKYDNQGIKKEKIFTNGNIVKYDSHGKIKQFIAHHDGVITEFDPLTNKKIKVIYPNKKIIEYNSINL